MGSSIRWSNLRYEISLDDEVREGAKRALEKMLELSA